MAKKSVFTNRLKEFRASKNLTQEELATMVGVTRQTIISIEKSEYVPSLVLAVNIARVFDKPVEELFSIPPLATT